MEGQITKWLLLRNTFKNNTIHSGCFILGVLLCPTMNKLFKIMCYVALEHNKEQSFFLSDM
jgi:hypothetical protein